MNRNLLRNNISASYFTTKYNNEFLDLSLYHNLKLVDPDNYLYKYLISIYLHFPFDITPALNSTFLFHDYIYGRLTNTTFVIQFLNHDFLLNKFDINLIDQHFWRYGFIQNLPQWTESDIYRQYHNLPFSNYWHHLFNLRSKEKELEPYIYIFLDKLCELKNMYSLLNLKESVS